MALEDRQTVLSLYALPTKNVRKYKATAPLYIVQALDLCAGRYEVNLQ
jgi:hypothetical protein